MLTIANNEVKMVVYQNQLTVGSTRDDDEDNDITIDLDDGVVRINGYMLTPSMKLNLLAFLKEEI